MLLECLGLSDKSNGDASEISAGVGTVSFAVGSELEFGICLLTRNEEFSFILLVQESLDSVLGSFGIFANVLKNG